MTNRYEIPKDPIKPSSLEISGQIGDGWLIWDNDYWYKWSEEDGQTAPPLMFDI